jgi:hypothetical protein
MESPHRLFKNTSLVVFSLEIVNARGKSTSLILTYDKKETSDVTKITCFLSNVIIFLGLISSRTRKKR